MSLSTGPSPARRSAPVRALIGALAAATLVAGAGASSAAAKAEGCTYTSFPHEYVCATINGKKLNVENVVVVRGALPAGAIDDYHAEVNIYTPAGKHHVYKSTVRMKKRYARAVVTVHINRSFPDGSKVCGAFFQRGDWVDSACNKLHD